MKKLREMGVLEWLIVIFTLLTLVFLIFPKLGVKVEDEKKNIAPERAKSITLEKTEQEELSPEKAEEEDLPLEQEE